MYLMLVFFRKINLSSFAYMRLLGVKALPLPIEVTPLGECVACAIGFPLYYFGGILYFLPLSYFSFSRNIYQLKVGQVKNLLFFLRVKRFISYFSTQGSNGKEN